MLTCGSGDKRAGRCRNLPGLVSGFCVPVVFGGMILLWSFAPAKNSQKYLVWQYLKIRPQEASRLIYLYNRPYSAEFYTSGKALEVKSPAHAEAFFANDVQDFYVVKNKWMNRLPDAFRKRLVLVDRFDDFTLLREELRGIGHENLAGG